MGYYTRGGGWGGEIRCFEPDNDSKTLYIEAHYTSQSLDDIFRQAQLHFGEQISMEDLAIEAQHIHTDCLGYDRYDSGDYTNYLVITLKDKS